MRKSYKFQRHEKKEKDYAFNYKIKAPEVMVIDETGVILGKMETRHAIETASERGFDLVEVSPNANPPVCKIMNYGSFKYQKEKLLKKQKKFTKALEVKSVRISIKISEHDLSTKAKQANGFLEKGHKIKVEVILRGREMAHSELARDVINEFISQLTIANQLEQSVTRQGNKFFAIIMPVKQDSSNDNNQ